MAAMKETYFSPPDVEIKAQEMLNSLKRFGHIHASAFAPQDSALLVLDLQAYFLDDCSHAFIPSAPAILPGINNLIRAYTARSLPVFLTRHINTSEDAGMMRVWWREIISPSNPFGMLDRRLERGGGIELIKTQYDAFLNSALEVFLRERSVKKVVVCGVMTHLCVETTARSAFMRGFEVFFPVDGSATYNEAFHLASLLNLAHGFATPLLVRDILQKLEPADG